MRTIGTLAVSTVLLLAPSLAMAAGSMLEGANAEDLKLFQSAAKQDPSVKLKLQQRLRNANNAEARGAGASSTAARAGGHSQVSGAASGPAESSTGSGSGGTPASGIKTQRLGH